MPTFPSSAHRDMLRAKCRVPGGLDPALLPVPERMQWHAYDYGWRRTVGARSGTLRSDSDDSPIDPRREWFAPDLIEQAAEWQRRGRP